MFKFHLYNDWLERDHCVCSWSASFKITWLDTTYYDTSTDVTLDKTFYVTILNFTFSLQIKLKK